MYFEIFVLTWNQLHSNKTIIMSIMEDLISSKIPFTKLIAPGVYNPTHNSLSLNSQWANKLVFGFFLIYTKYAINTKPIYFS